MADRPQRIQRRRVKGWKMPPGAVYVGRGSRWGNHWPVGTDACPTRADATAAYRRDVERNPPPDLHLLRGKDLACWCELDGQPCHGDVLIELANAAPR